MNDSNTNTKGDMMSKLEQMKELARTTSDDVLRNSIDILHADIVTNGRDDAKCLSRAVLFDVYEERNGEEAIDALFDELGM